jgi:hypothetical protein
MCGNINSMNIHRNNFVCLPQIKMSPWGFKTVLCTKYIKMIKRKRATLAGHCVGEMKNAYRILVGHLEDIDID